MGPGNALALRGLPCVEKVRDSGWKSHLPALELALLRYSCMCYVLPAVLGSIHLCKVKHFRHGRERRWCAETLPKSMLSCRWRT